MRLINILDRMLGKRRTRFPAIPPPSGGRFGGGYARGWRLPAFARKRQVLFVFAVIFLMLLSPIFLVHRKSHEKPDEKHRYVPTPKPKTFQEERLETKRLRPGQINDFHMLIAPSNSNISRCKTLLTSSVLGYPAPTLIGWNQTFEQSTLVGGGRYLAKIDGVLEWLEAQPKKLQKDLVLIVDSYGSFNYQDDATAVAEHQGAELFFQLRPQTLIERYKAMAAYAQKELVAQLGKAVKKEKLKQTIFFGSGKRCSPNEANTVSCYPIPESPLPADMYGANTDTFVGNSRHSSHRQRYLNAGYVIGPINDMRLLFRRAKEKADLVRASSSSSSSSSNNNNNSDALFRGSDQAIFQEIWGEQEFQREGMRRRHLSMGQKAKGMAKPRPLHVDGALVEDPLDPGFTHDPVEVKRGRPDEFGVAVDYYSDLGQQTFDSEADARFLTFGLPMEEQTRGRKQQGQGPAADQGVARDSLDCAPRVNGTLPWDVIRATVPRTAVSDAAPFSPNHGWDEIELFANMCLDTVPILVQHNAGGGGGGGTSSGDRDIWPRLWIQPHARALMDEVLARGEQTGGAWMGGTERYASWGELCPAEMEGELYREQDD